MKPATPILRNEHYLDVMTGGSASLPSPILREERYLAKLAGMDVSIPSPVTIKEFYYAKICGMDVDVPTYTRNMPRIYAYMAKAAGQTIEELPTAVTREQRYWYDYVSEQPVTEHEYTGAVPYTFTANGEPLLDWRISGNTVQSTTPTPDNPVMPNGTGERTAQLFDGEITGQDVGMGTNRYGFSIEEAGTYTIKITGDVENGDYCYARSYSNGEYSESFYLTTGSSKSTYTATISDGEKILVFNVSSAQTKAQSEAKFARWKIMANTGSTTLPYEPFGYKIPILSNNTTTPVYLGEVQTERKVKKKIITGSQVVGYSAGTNYITVKTEVPELKHPENRAVYLCTHFQVASTAAEGKVVNRYANFYNVEFYLSTTFASLDEVRAWFDEQNANGTPVIIYATLITPETGIVNEPLMKIGDYVDSLTATQAGVTIPTNNGSNTFDVDTTVKPSEVYIKYKGV